ncbi:MULTISPECIES: CoA pyrophosphatase [Falsihalocynthiibacter]|uniref:Coenzyme A pyrophosphatase n=1 Tax=Falsihalocynthiibacter arcticus TaxID=1579316 RepID=A0A126UZ13_9RHOB|nr:coenzyme A pyrophosphatase [Falsihalocynthiibacter arcticus]
MRQVPRDLLQAILDAASRGGSSDFDLNRNVVLPPNRPLREAAVLVPVIETDRGFQLILTKRASHLKHHPGQIAFPGGKRDAEDDTLVTTALREAQEEIGLLRDNVEVLGQIPPHETVTGFTMTPVLGLVRAEFVPNPEQGEVAEVFRVPLAHVLDIERYQVQSRSWRGVERNYYTVPFGPYYIWGATARVLRRMADGLNNAH